MILFQQNKIINELRFLVPQSGVFYSLNSNPTRSSPSNFVFFCLIMIAVHDIKISSKIKES